MLLNCDVRDEHALFETVWPILGDDMQHRMRQVLGNHSLLLAPHDIKDMVLDEIAVLLNKRGSSIDEFCLPKRTAVDTRCRFNHLVEEELSYDLEALEIESNLLCSQLNSEQLEAFNQITASVFAGTPGFYFVAGFGGIGKTFL